MPASLEVPRPVQLSYQLWIVLVGLVMARLLIRPIAVGVIAGTSNAPVLQLGFALAFGLAAIGLRLGYNWARILLASVGGLYALLDGAALTILVPAIFGGTASTWLAFAAVVLSIGSIAVIVAAITLMLRPAATPYFG